MRLFKGNFKSKVYDKSKPVKRGLKYYMGVDGHHYCFWFKLYRKEEEKEKGKITFNLCKEMVECLPKDMGSYIIYGDNYYGSMDIAEWLQQNGFKFTFMCRLTRPSYLFKDLLAKNLKNMGEIKQMAVAVNDEKNIAALGWKDKNYVWLLSNQYGSEIGSAMRRQHKETEKSNQFVPVKSQDYTENRMRHVDTFNSNMVRADPTHKNFLWRRTHFLTMLKISLVNMWIIYCWIKKKNFIQRQVLESFKEELKKKFQESYE